MKNSLLIGAGVLLVILTLVVFGYFGLVVYINGPNDRLIAKNVEFTEEWQEIGIDPPIMPSKYTQYLGLRIKGVDGRNTKNFEIHLPNGTLIEPELVLRDDNGNTLESHHDGFALGSSYDDVEFRPGSQNNPKTIPNGRTYTKLRIRSNIPFKCDQIVWCDYDSK